MSQTRAGINGRGRRLANVAERGRGRLGRPGRGRYGDRNKASWRKADTPCDSYSLTWLLTAPDPRANISDSSHPNINHPIHLCCQWALPAFPIQFSYRLSFSSLTLLSFRAGRLSHFSSGPFFGCRCLYIPVTSSIPFMFVTAQDVIIIHFTHPARRTCERALNTAQWTDPRRPSIASRPHPGLSLLD